MGIEILKRYSQYFDTFWAFPLLDFGAKKTKGQDKRPGMDRNAPGPSEDVPNRGLAIDLTKDNPNQTRPKKQRTLFQSGMFRVEKGAENSVLVTE